MPRRISDSNATTVFVLFVCVMVLFATRCACLEKFQLNGVQYKLVQSNTTCENVGCGGHIPDLDPLDKICQVEGDELPVDCNCTSENATPTPKESCRVCFNETTGRISFPTVQDALNKCPYDPMVIEVTGTHYVGNLTFPNRKEVVLRGYITHSERVNCSVVNGTRLKEYTTFHPKDKFKYLLNVTYVRVPVVGPPAVLVGSNWSVSGANTSLVFENITVDGCGTDSPLFQLCGWENPPNITGKCNATQFTEEPDMCEKNVTHIRMCMSSYKYRMDCTRYVAFPGPCFVKGEFVEDCPPHLTFRWLCKDSDPLGSATTYVCRWDDVSHMLVECDLPPPPPSASPSNRPDTGCPNCDNPPPVKEEKYTICPPPVVNVTYDPPCDKCLTNNNVTMYNSTVRNFNGPYVLKVYALELNVSIDIEDSNFVDIPGNAVHAQGQYDIVFNRNLMERCGGLWDSCIYLKHGYASRGIFELVGNVHFLINNTIPFPCDYYFNGDVRCDNGVLKCLDFVNTTLNDCDYQVNKRGMTLWNEDCAVYMDCPCSARNLTQLANNTAFVNQGAQDFNTTSNGIVVRVLFDLSDDRLPYSVGQIIFFPCHELQDCANGTTGQVNGTYGTFAPYVGSYAYYPQTGSQNCSAPINRTFCPCPKGPESRAGSTCNVQISGGVSCQNGLTVCSGGMGLANVTIMNGTVYGRLGKVSNSSANNDTGACAGSGIGSCKCPALNITTAPDGSVVSVQFASSAAGMMIGGKFDGLLWAVTNNYQIMIGGVPYTCMGEVLKCNCTASAGASKKPCYKVNNCSSAFHIGHISDESEHVNIWNNVAEGLPKGLHLEQTSWEVIVANSYKVHRWFWDKGVLHEIVRQNNNFTGTVNDTFYGLSDCANNTMWNVVSCNEGCPMSRPREMVDACGVDLRFNKATPGYGTLRYTTIQQAINVCPFVAVIVHRGVHFYEEQLRLNRVNLYLLSYNNATIVRSNHTIGADNVTLRGLLLQHDMATPYPILRPEFSSPERYSYLSYGIGSSTPTPKPGDTNPPANFSVYNCIVNGNSVRDAGFLVGDIGPGMVVSYNVISTFIARAVDVWTPGPTRVNMNYYVVITGRSLRIWGAWSMHVQSNLFVNCRGTTFGNEVEIVMLQTIDASDGIVGSLDPSGEDPQSIMDDAINGDSSFDPLFAECSGNQILSDTMGCNWPINSTQEPCYVRGNGQFVDENVRDRNDVFMVIRGGNRSVDDVMDNWSTKARIGMMFMWAVGFENSTRDQVHHNNPGIRVRDSQKNEEMFGFDLAFMRVCSRAVVGCSYPFCRNYTVWPPDFVVNKNYGWCVTPRYGFDTWNNVTAADRLAGPFLYFDKYNVSFTVRVTQENGSRISRENITLNRPIKFVGDPWPCGLLPVIIGNSHALNTWYVWMERMEYRYGDVNKNSGAPLWYTPVNDKLHFLMINASLMVGMDNPDGGRIWVIRVFLNNRNGTFNLLDTAFFRWWHHDDYTVVPQEMVFVEGKRPDAPYLNANVTSVSEKSQKDLEKRCSTASKHPRVSHKRMCPKGKCREYYTNSNNGVLGKPIPILIYPDGRRVRADMAPATLGVMVKYGDGAVPSRPLMVIKSLLQRQQDALYFTEFGDREDRVAEIMGQLVLRGYLPPLVDRLSLRYAAESIYDETYTEVGDPEEVSAEVYQRLTRRTYARVENCSFWDIDGSVLYVGPTWNGFLVNNSMLNCGLRDPISYFGFLLEGYKDSNGSYVVNLNRFNQTRSPLFPQAGIKTMRSNTGTPVNFAAFWMHSMCNASVWQFRNNTSAINSISIHNGTVSVTSRGTIDGRNITGAMYGARFSGICNDTFAKNIPPDQVIYDANFRPEQLPLRLAVKYGNDGVKGLVCDVIFCELHNDLSSSTKSFRNDCTCCNDGCRAPPPPKCVVDRDNSTFVPGNPYWQTYLFTSLNDAVANCTAASRIIEVRVQSDPYTEDLVLTGEGNFKIVSPSHAVFRTSNIRINAPGLQFQDVLFQHEGGMPLITTDIQYLANVSFSNTTFAGGGTYQPAIQGTFHNLTLQGCTFKKYESDYLMNITSDCGDLTIISCVFKRVPGAVVWATNLCSYSVNYTTFVNCGSRRPDINPMVYLQGVILANGTVNSTGPMNFENNVSVQNDTTGIILKPDCGYGTTFFFNGLPSNGNYHIYRNRASGLGVGIRVANVTDIATDEKAIIGKRPQLLEYKILYYWQNTLVYGTWQNAVRGMPCDDNAYDADPYGQRGRAFKDTPQSGRQNTTLLLLFFFIFALAMLMCCCLCFCQSDRRKVNYVESATLGVPIPTRRDLWPWIPMRVNGAGDVIPVTEAESQDMTSRFMRRKVNNRKERIEDSNYFFGIQNLYGGDPYGVHTTLVAPGPAGFVRSESDETQPLFGGNEDDSDEDDM